MPARSWHATSSLRSRRRSACGNVFVVLEVGPRWVLHWDVTEHPPAEWTAQQFRMLESGDDAHRFVIHDQDAIYSEGGDRTIVAMGLTVLTTPVHSPQANTFCEPLMHCGVRTPFRARGPMRRRAFCAPVRAECLDWLLIVNQQHLERILAVFVDHYTGTGPLERCRLCHWPWRPPATESASGDACILHRDRPRRCHSRVRAGGVAKLQHVTGIAERFVGTVDQNAWIGSWS